MLIYIMLINNIIYSFTIILIIFYLYLKNLKFGIFFSLYAIFIAYHMKLYCLIENFNKN